MKNNQDAPFGIHITRLHLTVFYFFCANFSVLSVSLFRYLNGKAEKNTALLMTDFNPSAVAHFNVFMLPQMLFYVVSSALLGIALLLALYIGNRPHRFPLFFKYNLRYCILFVTCLCIIGCFLKTWLSILIPFYILIAALFYPRIIGAIPLGDNREVSIKNIYKNIHSITINVLFLVCCGFVIYLFYPQIFNKPVILNPYLRIPEQFKFFQNSEGKDFITSIDNTTIINDFDLFKDHEKIDIENPDWQNNSACYEIPVYNHTLAELVEVYQWKNRFPPGSFYQASTTVFYPMLFYRDNYLCVIKADGTANVANQVETINKELIADLTSVLGKDFGERLEQDFQKGFIHGNSDKMKNLPHSEFSLQERLNLYGDKTFRTDFIKKSINEMSLQFNFRGQFKHHIYYLFPAYEYLMGKPLNKISHQYGLGMTLIPSLAAKIFNDGEPNYGVAINLISATYYLAFFSLLVVIFYISHDLRIIIIASFLYIYNQLVIGHELTLFTFGTYEVRTFCSIPMMLAVYLYCQNTTWTRFFFILCFSFCGLFINFEFGLMITIAALATLITHIVLVNKIYFIHIIRILLIILCIFISEKLFNIGPKAITEAFLGGFFSKKIPLGDILLLITQLLAYFFFFIHMLIKKSKFAFVFLYSVFLAQELLTYYIWNGYTNHFFIYFTRLTLPALFYLTFIFSFKKKTSLKMNSIFYILVTLSIVLIVKQSEIYHRQSRSYKNVLNNYRTYQWDLPGTSFISTMNPAYFYPSVELISKYSDTQNKEICLISQYDSMFLLLSKKISILPTFDLVGFLMTKKENMLIEKTIKEKQPEYLFVDNDILGPYELDIAPVANFGEWLHLESRLRVFSLKEIANIFLKIKDDYELLESTNMLSVYRRKVYEQNDK